MECSSKGGFAVSPQGDKCDHHALRYTPRTKTDELQYRLQCQAASLVGDRVVENKSTQSRPRETAGSTVRYLQDLDTTNHAVHTAGNAVE